jgi:alkaline phosphatase
MKENSGNDKAALVFSSFPSQGMTTTMEANNLITDSAAAGTAMASGIKTDKGVVGKDVNLKDVVTVAELAKKAGKKVGIISSVSIDHATPATFYAHQDKRGNYYEISESLAKSNFDYFAGGGAKGNSASKRKEREDILSIAKNNGFYIASDKASFDKAPKGKKVFAYNKNLDGSKALPYDMDRQGEDISLADFTAKGIDLLDNDNGFFMMVEAGKIDWACHRNDAAAAIKDSIAFNDAIKKALDFYNKHKDETLIVVTGDHECGGMTIGFAGTKNKSNYKLLANQKVSCDIIDAELNKAVEEKASFNKIMSILEDTMSFGKNIQLSEYDKSQLKKAYDFAMQPEDVKKAAYKDTQNETYLKYGEAYYSPIGVVATHILDNKAGIGWSSYYHTGIPIGTYAIGTGNTLFEGSYDNTDIFKKVLAVGQYN